MAYNRTLDLLAMCLAYTQAGMPIKAAAFIHEAANDPSAKVAVEAILAANKKKKPAKKKAKSSFAGTVFAELGLDEEGEGSDETVESLVSALEDLEEDKEEAAPVSAKVRAARRALAEAEAEEETEEETAGDEAGDDEVFKLKSSKRTKADTVDNADLEVGEDLREEVPATRSKASFARALRNLAARQA